MMDIISHIGAISGIDDAVYASTDTGTAKKIISLAQISTRYERPVPIRNPAWQYNHPIPYEDGITEDRYHNLFVDIGTDESLQQSFFK